MQLPLDFSAYVPDGLPLEKALDRTTHMGIGAHPDDLEIFAFHGITQCYRKKNRWFTGVTVCDGAGSARSGRFSKLSDQQMAERRKLEQYAAAHIGQYGCQLMLGYSSQALKSKSGAKDISHILSELLIVSRPQVVYLHNPADKHDSHVALSLASLKSLKDIPTKYRPKTVLGCEVWRDLDWAPDHRKIHLSVSGHEKLAARLLGCFTSQIVGGKRYDLATLGRRRAQATFQESHSVDAETSVILALDLTPALHGDVEDYFLSLIRDFERDVKKRIRRFARRAKS